MKNGIKTRIAIVGLLTLLVGGLVTQVHSHCQIPCGIYDDDARLKMIAEHTRTIEKSMKQIVALSEMPSDNYNQIVRWINNKEYHADAISEIVTDYFLMQRVKSATADSPKYKSYVRQLTLLHEILLTGMKCKQTTELSHVEKLKMLLNEFTEAYKG